MSEEQQPSTAPDILAGLARRLRTLREGARLTQDELARRSGLSVSFTSLLERGERSPSYETLFALASALDVPVSELLRERPGVEMQDPSLLRLVDFARRARLTRAQIERWIAVGRAMFGLAEVSLEGDALAHCAEPDCDRLVLAKGLCAPHYHRERRRRLRG
jgi:transcriptional regulator with XRE-family HTH domain